MGTLEVDKLDPQSGTALEIGTSGDTATVPSGVTLTVAGTLNPSGTITAGTIAGTAIANDAIDSQHYADGSIDTAHIANDQITAALMADNSIDSDMYVDGSIDTAHIGATQVTGAKLNTDIISAQTALAVAPADTDEFMVSDAGVLKRIDYSLIKGINATNFRPNAKPIIINGDMAVNQRGTVTGVATNTYVIDMWTTQGDDCTLTISKDTDVPTGEGFALLKN